MNRVITAEDGKVFKRKSDGMIYGSKITLGYTYYINNKVVNPPHLDTEEDFEEIELQNIEENND